MIKFTTAGCLLALFGVMACAPRSTVTESSEIGDEAPAAWTTTIPYDVAAITRLHQDWTAAINAGDMERVLAPLAADVILFPPNEPPVVGLEASRTWFQRVVVHLEQITFTDANLVIDEVVVAGDWAFSRGTFHGTFEPRSGGPSFSDVTTTLLVWRRQPDGSWRITRDIWNSDHPPPTERTSG